mgnify:CR=1 FL=1
MAKSNRLGMKTFDQALYDLFESRRDLVRGGAAERRLEERDPAADQAREQARRQVALDETAALEIIVKKSKTGSSSMTAIDSEGCTTTTPSAWSAESGDDAQLRAQHQAAVQADGRQEGLGPVLHVELPDQDQDRGPDHADQPGRCSSAEQVRQAALRPHEPGADRLLPAGSSRSTFAISEPGLGRFRVAVFHQRGNPAMVLRYITAGHAAASRTSGCPRS